MITGLIVYSLMALLMALIVRKARRREAFLLGVIRDLEDGRHRGLPRVEPVHPWPPPPVNS